MDNSPVGFVCLNGDLINDRISQDLGRQALNNAMKKFDYLPTDKFFVTIGNHEFNNAGNSESYRDRQLSLDDIYSITNKRSETFIRDIDGFDYYVDNKAQKIRHYFIGSSIGSNPYSGANKWLADSLANIDNGCSVIVFSHIGLNSSASDWESSLDIIVALLEAYKNHTTYMLDGRNYDFSSKDGDVIGVFSGHMHLDGAIKTAFDIPFIATTCDA
nr:MAG TPA: metallophosphatase domain protein [Bacteriophage sp.]